VTFDFVGIARERVYSPGKVDADRAILDGVAAQLRIGARVDVITADEPLPERAPASVIFAMCQGPAALSALRRWEAAGTRVINSTLGIANTHRERMVAAFEHHGVTQPPSLLVRTDGSQPLPHWIDAGIWLKRGDVHATEPEDVVHLSGEAATRTALASMHRRGIATALVQRHVDGDVFKFYAVRGRFFAWFASGEPCAPLDAASEHAMRALADAGAAALDLEVFGGDCVRDRQQNLWLIDLNDWPSYGACRAAAAEAIASYLTTQTRRT
jgi:hypothetical protein